jgi:phosphopantetheinyl transferase (holo-ACP synthase)
VDLKDAANSGKSRDSRFLKKILTDAEIEYVTHADHPDSALWLLWACKETAYKVIKKILPDIVFAPRQWQVNVHNIKSEYAEGEVGIPGKDGVFIRLFAGADYIHCAGSDDKATLDNLIWSVEPLPDEETCPSLFSRRCLAQSLAGRFSLDFHQIKIQRKRRNGELQPPYVYVDGRQTDTEISLSHDGRFVAYAFGSTAQRK